MALTVLCAHLLLLSNFLSYGHSQERPSAVLRQDDSMWSPVFTGEYVTLICDMNEGERTDWKYKLDRDGAELYSYSKEFTFKLQPGNSEYQCTGYRIKDPQQIKTSNKFTLAADDKPKATLTADPTDLPIGGSVRLSCSVGGSTGWEWVYNKKYQNGGLIRHDAAQHSDGSISVSEGGVYSCIGKRGQPVYYTEHSNTITVDTIAKPKAALTADQVPVGGTVRLTCSVEGSSGWKWEYNRCQDDSWIRAEGVKNPDGSISVSEGGVYRCIGKTEQPVYYTEPSETVTVDTVVTPSKPTQRSVTTPTQPSVSGSTQTSLTGSGQPPTEQIPPLVVGLIVGVLVVILMIILLVLLRRHRASKDPGHVRSTKSQGTNRDSAGDQRTNQRGSPDRGHSPSQHDVSAAEFGDVTYSQIEIKHLAKKEKEKSSAESDPLYSEVKTALATGAGDTDVTYAEVNQQFNRKAKKKKEETEDTIYSQVKPGTAQCGD